MSKMRVGAFFSGGEVSVGRIEMGLGGFVGGGVFAGDVGSASLRMEDGSSFRGDFSSTNGCSSFLGSYFPGGVSCSAGSFFRGISFFNKSHILHLAYACNSFQNCGKYSTAPSVAGAAYKNGVASVKFRLNGSVPFINAFGGISETPYIICESPNKYAEYLYSRVA